MLPSRQRGMFHAMISWKLISTWNLALWRAKSMSGSMENSYPLMQKNWACSVRPTAAWQLLLGGPKWLLLAPLMEKFAPLLMTLNVYLIDADLSFSGYVH